VEPVARGLETFLQCLAGPTARVRCQNRVLTAQGIKDVVRGLKWRSTVFTPDAVWGTDFAEASACIRVVGAMPVQWPDLGHGSY
jgi:hypothetical protein